MYHIGTGWTGTVYACTVRETKNGVVWAKRDDCTSEFYATLIELARQNDNELVIKMNGKPKYEVILKEIDKCVIYRKSGRSERIELQEKI